jgi:hypothetical protein
MPIRLINMEIWQEVGSYVEMQSDENYANCNTDNGNPNIFNNVKYRKCFFLPQIYALSDG